jgi:hypothetical protein
VSHPLMAPGANECPQGVDIVEEVAVVILALYF